MDTKIEEENNSVVLKGRIETDIEFSHESFNEKFYKTKIVVSRLSGDTDTLSLVIPEVDLENIEVLKGDAVLVEGEARSYNKYITKGENTIRKLKINVFVKKITKIDEEELKDKSETNKVNLIGHICKKPIYRKTPFGREISDILLAVNRFYGKSDYLPVIAWGRNARFASNLEIGDIIKIEGRFQSRAYKKVLDDETEEERVAYEISIVNLELFDEEENKSEEDKEENNLKLEH